MIVTVNVSCQNQTVTWTKITPYVGNLASQGVSNGRTYLYTKSLGKVVKVDTGGMYHSIFLNVCQPQISGSGGNVLIREYFSSGPNFSRYKGSPFLDQWVRYYLNYGISTVAQLKAAEARMSAAGVEIPSDLEKMYFGKAGDGALLEFLRDESDAKDKGVTIAEARRLRLAWVAQRKAEMARQEAQQAVARRAEQARIARIYPYVAVISCGLNGWENINVLACFAGSDSGAATELEINNGGAYALYKPHEIAGNFIQQQRGIEIPLKQKFSIKIQNSHRTVKLGLRIFDRSGNVIYQRQVAQYGVIYTSR
ncbi:hypothetical protein GCM10011617_29970 [Novosphingobium arvoryzae]|uniref:Uncharacterized protein n=2 Tax=Novosphingobium arvoryzae TaxID=1256514 RepID=A0A918VLL9_9SPHN|nr:hypothetical protein GCM10011617_29970 [Novosphingobium arvoryzae]